MLTNLVGPPLDELPGDPRSKSRWELIAAECRQTPGQWRQINLDYSEGGIRNASVKVCDGTYAAFRDGDWDAAVRSKKLFIRFMGGDPA